MGGKISKMFDSFYFYRSLDIYYRKKKQIIRHSNITMTNKEADSKFFHQITWNLSTLRTLFFGLLNLGKLLKAKWKMICRHNEFIKFIHRNWVQFARLKSFVEETFQQLKKWVVCLSAFQNKIFFLKIYSNHEKQFIEGRTGRKIHEFCVEVDPKTPIDLLKIQNSDANVFLFLPIHWESINFELYMAQANNAFFPVSEPKFLGS